MEALQDLATYAASHRIRGKSYKRNSLLKPLDIILNELDRCPDTKNPDEMNLIKAGTKGLILAHIQRVTKGVHEDTVYQYVEIFFEQVLKEAHHNNANRLLQRERLLRSAYLVYMREALAQIFIARGKARTSDEAMQALQAAESQERDEEEPDQES